MFKNRKTPWKDLIEKGDYRIARLVPWLYQKYQRHKNVRVIPHYGKGTGTDIVVISLTPHGKRDHRILELREVTNWQRFAKNGQKIYMSWQKARQYVKSLTQKCYFLYYGKSKKRFYPDSGTKRYLDVSYLDNIPKNIQIFLKNNGVKIKVWNRTDFPFGYIVEDNKGNKRYFDWKGNEIVAKRRP